MRILINVLPYPFFWSHNCHNKKQLNPKHCLKFFHRTAKYKSFAKKMEPAIIPHQSMTEGDYRKS